MSYTYHKIKDIPSNREIMKQAKAALQHKLIRAIACNIVIPLGAETLRCIIRVALLLAFAVMELLPVERNIWYHILSFGLLFVSCLLQTGCSTAGQIYNQLGSIKWYLTNNDGGTPEIISCFKYAFNHYISYICAILTGTLIVFGKTLLFVIPGIMAYLDYAMVGFCMADDPALGPWEALKRSRAIMYGHRWQLYCMWWRFAGWIVLCIITCGIGFIVLVPYIVSAHAAFYRAIMPEQTDENFSELPPTADGRKPLSKRANAVILAALLILFAALAALTVTLMENR